MKKGILVALFLLDVFQSFSQGNFQNDPVYFYNGNYSNEDFFRKADYIFEGIPISSQSYALDSCDLFTYYTSILVKITEIYKGKLKTGTIEIIVAGGMVPCNGRMRRFTNNGHGLSTPIGRKIIFFCLKSKFPKSTIKIKKDNDISLEYLQDRPFACIYNPNIVSFGLGEGKIAGLRNLIFYSKYELFKYMNQFKGIKLPGYKYDKHNRNGIDSIDIIRQKKWDECR